MRKPPLYWQMPREGTFQLRRFLQFVTYTKTCNFVAPSVVNELIHFHLTVLMKQTAGVHFIICQFTFSLSFRLSSNSLFTKLLRLTESRDRKMNSLAKIKRKTSKLIQSKAIIKFVRFPRQTFRT